MREVHQASADTLLQLIVGIGILLALIIVAVLIVQRFRGSAVKTDLSASVLMTNFQEMRKRGDISEADYRKVKSVLGEQLQSDVKSGKDRA